MNNFGVRIDGSDKVREDSLWRGFAKDIAGGPTETGGPTENCRKSLILGAPLRIIQRLLASLDTPYSAASAGRLQLRGGAGNGAPSGALARVSL
jgi:hypothetical protein